MFVDYETSRRYAELRDEAEMLNRKRQLDAIHRMGFDKPCGQEIGNIVVAGNYALISIDVSVG